MGASRFTASYLIESPLTPQQAAEAMAGEQSTGTFVAIPGDTAELRERHGAHVESVMELETNNQPALPGSLPAAEYQRAQVTISWPQENIGSSIPNLLATVLGNLTELKELSAIRLIGLALDPSFIQQCPGPAFGVPGTRQLSGVRQGPLVGTIIKPSVGLSPEQTADLVSTLVEAGLDFIKDDELIADPPYSPFGERVDAVMGVINDFADRTGRKPMYAFNLTGTIDEMRARHDQVLAAGGTCVMASMNWIGMAGLAALRAHSQLPIHGHRNGWGLLGRAPQIGMDYTILQQLLRLAGADHLHVSGLNNKFYEQDESVMQSARACLTPLLEASDRDDRAMPVFSSGQTALQAPETYVQLGSTDLIYACGGGIMAHPQGTAAGCRSIRAAWQAAVEGEHLRDRALRDPDLAGALAKFAPLEQS